MGEMTIRLDDALLVQAVSRAEHLGVPLETFVESVVADALRAPLKARLPIAAAIRARGGPLSPISSVELLDQIRDGAG